MLASEAVRQAVGPRVADGELDPVRTFLVSGGTRERAGWRHGLFVKVHTDTGSTGSGSAGDGRGSCRPAIEDLTPLVVGEDPFLIERIWQKLYASTQGHGMTGVVGSGAITGIELALWDLKGSATASGSTATRSTRSGRASWSTGDSRR